MSKKDDEYVAVVRNTTGRKIVRDLPEMTGNKAVMFKGDSFVRLTRKEMEHMGKAPEGCVVEQYDKWRHGEDKNRK